MSCVPLKDELVALPTELTTSSVIDMPSYDHSLYRDDYMIPRPNLESSTAFSTSSITTSAREKRRAGETHALTLLTDYLIMGESMFNQRYAEEYAHTFSTTKSHREAIQRLTNGYLSTAAIAAPTDGNSATPAAMETIENHHFDGEIISALLAPSLGTLQLALFSQPTLQPHTLSELHVRRLIHFFHLPR